MTSCSCIFYRIARQPPEAVDCVRLCSIATAEIHSDKAVCDLGRCPRLRPCVACSSDWMCLAHLTPHPRVKMWTLKSCVLSYTTWHNECICCYRESRTLMQPHSLCTAWVHFHWWSWIQSSSNQASGPKCYRTKSLCERPWSAWGKYHHVCCHQSGKSSPSPCQLGPYNTAHIITFLDALRIAVAQDRPEQPGFVVFWDAVRGTPGCSYLELVYQPQQLLPHFSKKIFSAWFLESVLL